MNHDELAELLALIAEDGMSLSWWTVPVADVVFVKGILEAYPGIVAMHAPPGRVLGERAPFAVATTAGWKKELAAIMTDLAAEVAIRSSSAPPENGSCRAGLVERAGRG